VDPSVPPQTIEGTILTIENAQLVVWAAGTEVARIDLEHLAAVELESKTYTLESVRMVHGQAYERWSDVEEQALRSRLDEGASMAQLVQEFGRGRGAIRSRLNRLGVALPL
jgi:hypothetical protein